jgi:hypothetical protein
MRVRRSQKRVQEREKGGKRKKKGTYIALK